MKRIDRRSALVRVGALAAAGWGFPPICRAEVWEDFDEWYRRPDWPDGKRAIEEAPPRIVEERKIRLGIFREPIRRMNLLESRVLDGRAKSWWGRPRLQEWVGYGVIHPRWYLGMIIMDFKVVTIASLYCLDREKGGAFSHDAVDGGDHSGVSETSWSGRTFMERDGFRLEFLHDLDHGRHQLRIDLAEGRGKPAVQLDLKLIQDLGRFQPLVNSLPVYPRHFMYTQKAKMQVEGGGRIGGETVEYDPLRDQAAVDEHKSFTPLPKRWTWGTGAGKSKAGAALAFNLGDQFSRDQQTWNENCLWVDGELNLLGEVRWSHDPRDPGRPWRVIEQNGRAEIDFSPEGGKAVEISPLGFKYYQRCGRYRGFIIDGSGARHEFDDLYGPAENGRIGFGQPRR